jgi:hypothetical protein
MLLNYSDEVFDHLERNRHRSPYLIGKYLEFSDRSPRLESQLLATSDDGPVRHRWPYNTDTKPSYPVAKDCPFPLEDLTERSFGTNWFDWTRKVSLAAVIDLDLIDEKKNDKGMTAVELEASIAALSKLDYATLVRSTGGNAIHLYVWFHADDLPVASNHNDHKQNTLRAIAKIEKDSGIKLKIDAAGSIMWFWADRQTPESFKVIKQGRSLRASELPELPVVTTVQSKAPVVEDDGHQRILNECAEKGFTPVEVDHHGTTVYRMHSCVLKKVHESLNLKGSFNTSSPGSDLSQQNSYMVPLPDGAFKIKSFGNEPSWHQGDKGESYCYFNQEPKQYEPKQYEPSYEPKRFEPTKGQFYERHIGVASLLEEKHEIDWLVEGLFAERKFTIVGGPSKCLKTNIAILLASQIATGGKFMGHECRKRKVIFFSGEMEGSDISSIVKRQKHLLSRPMTNDELILNFNLPRLTRDETLGHFADYLDREKPGVVFIDPLYLAIDGGKQSDHIDSADQLRKINDVCRHRGVTLFVLYHAKKGMFRDYRPMGLDDLSGAGFDQYARQYFLISRRSEYKFNGKHEFFYALGSTGSAMNSELYHADIVEGEMPNLTFQLSWKTAREAASQEKQTKDEKTFQECLAKAKALGNSFTKTSLSVQTKDHPAINKIKTGRFIDQALNTGAIKIAKHCGRATTYTCV